MKEKGLGEARRVFRARKFPDVIRILEPEVFRYRESFDYFSLLGFSCLHTGDLGGAFSYLSRARQLSPDNVSALLGLAAIHFRRQETGEAIKRWLEVLELDPGNAVARRGMELLRKGFSREKLQEYIDAGKFKSLYPPLPSRGRAGLVVTIVLGILALAAAGYAGVRFLPRQVVDRPGVVAVEIPKDLPRLTETGSDFLYMLTEDDVRKAFTKAKSFLLAYRDNMALVEINRILLSNAALPVKEKARLLKGFVTQPDFLTVKDPFPYAVVAAQPPLYDGCSVIWRGKIANLKILREAITFDLLVGYDKEKVLEGIVPVTLDFAADLANGGGIEVLGQVSSKGGKIGLSAISIHKLAGN
ncbi:MAG TPA: tetratricopeptide repeat protein [Spirochaetia bacterium]|nr:tetratricopeptide repeat protein [Spirochaetia bacterium]